MSKCQEICFKQSDYQRCREIEQILTDAPSGFGVDISHRKRWEILKGKPNIQEYIEAAEKYLLLPAVTVSDENYLAVSRTGERAENDRVSADQGNAIRSLCIAECIENSGRYLKKYEESIMAACNQKSWNLSIHDNRFDTFYGRDLYIDLRVATFGWQLAQCDYLLGNRVSRQIRDLLRENLERRILQPFQRILEGKKAPYFWVTAESNWNVVCLSGCLGVALTILADKARRALFIWAFEKYSESGLRCYRDDGYCIEEIGYWGYGFSHYLTGAELIRRNTSGAIDLFENRRIKLSCLYGLRSEITDQVYASVGDTQYGAKAHPVNIQYIGNRLRIAGDRKISNTEIGRKHTEYLYQLLMFWFWEEETKDSLAEGAGDFRLSQYDYFESTQVLICRPKEGNSIRMGAFIKGGDNHQPHNHLDVGNFVVEVNGETLIADCGHPPYNAATFTDARYRTKALNSYGHNVPLVGGLGQKGDMNDGRAGRGVQRLYAGEVLEKELSKERDRIIYDLRAAYDLPFVRELRREFLYEREGKITVRDYFSFANPEQFEMALITYADVEYDRELAFYGEAYGLRIRLPDVPYTIKFETLEPCKMAGTDALIQPKRIGIRLRDNLLKGTFVISITPFEREQMDKRIMQEKERKII